MQESTGRSRDMFPSDGEAVCLLSGFVEYNQMVWWDFCDVKERRRT